MRIRGNLGNAAANPLVDGVALTENVAEATDHGHVQDVPCVIGMLSENIAPLDIDLAEQRDGVLGVVAIAGTEQKNKRIA